MKKKLLSFVLITAMLLSVFAVFPATSGADTTGEVMPYRCGDADGNGRITINDALEILKYLAKLDNVIDGNTAALYAARAVTRTATPLIGDALEILKHLAKLESYFDKQCWCADWCWVNRPTTPVTTPPTAVITTAGTLPTLPATTPQVFTTPPPVTTPQVFTTPPPVTTPQVFTTPPPATTTTTPQVLTTPPSATTFLLTHPSTNTTATTTAAATQTQATTVTAAGTTGAFTTPSLPVVTTASPATTVVTTASATTASVTTASATTASATTAGTTPSLPVVTTASPATTVVTTASATTAATTASATTAATTAVAVTTAATTTTASRFVITFNQNFSGAPANVSVNANSNGTLASANVPENPTRSGFIFNGWFLAASGGTALTFGSNGHTFSGNATVWAQWTAATANIMLTPTAAHTFREEVAGYSSAPAAHTLTITNTGTSNTGLLNMTLSGSGASAFTLSAPSFGSGVDAGANRTFTVRPVTGLAAGAYTATVTVSGAAVTTRTVNVSFTVLPAGQGGGAIQNMSAHNVVANMNVGWNLGNTFDAVGTASNGLFDWDNMHTMTSSNIINIETAWIGGTSNRTTPELIRAVKAAGFDTLRIPVTWWKATNANSGNLSGNTYQINSAFMARVKEVVDMAIAADMYVILNTHHEERVMPLGSSGRTQAIRTVDVLWTQIAREFRNYDHRLVFAGLNEPREIGGEGEWWGGTSTTRETLNLMNQAFVDRVRADGASGSGNNNRWRILAVPTYAAGANPDSPVFVGFRIPTDTSSGAVNKIIMAIHTYSPFDWAHNGRGSYGSGGNDLARIRRDLDFVRTQARNLGVPVVLSEWGSVNAGQMSQRVTHAEDYVREARARGMATVWWDNASADTRANEHGFGLFSRRAPHAPSLSYGGQTYNFQQIIDAIMRGRRATFTPS